MTVNEIINKIDRLRDISKELQRIADVYGENLPDGDASTLDDAADIIYEYIEELGKKKVQ